MMTQKQRAWRWSWKTVPVTIALDPDQPARMAAVAERLGLKGNRSALARRAINELLSRYERQLQEMTTT